MSEVEGGIAIALNFKILGIRKVLPSISVGFLTLCPYVVTSAPRGICYPHTSAISLVRDAARLTLKKMLYSKYKTTKKFIQVSFYHAR